MMLGPTFLMRMLLGAQDYYYRYYYYYYKYCYYY